MLEIFQGIHKLQRSVSRPLIYTAGHISTLAVDGCVRETSTTAIQLELLTSRICQKHSLGFRVQWKWGHSIKFAKLSQRIWGQHYWTQ